MRFVVIGAGGLGSVLAAYLARAGEPVSVIAREAHARAIQIDGLDIVGDSGASWQVSLPAYSAIEDAELREDDVLFCTAKSYDTAEIVERVAASSSDAPFLCVQNGIRNEEVAARSLRRVYGVMARFKGRLLEPGRVYAPGAHHLTFGRYPSGVDEFARTVARRCADAGIRASTSDDIMRQKWTKLVANCVNAVYAIANVQIERVWVDAALGAFINRVWDEAEAVMARAGVSFDPTTRVPPPGSQPPPSSGAVEYYGSTWDDVALRKGRSEVEWFNGEIVRLAASCGTDAPLNRLLLDVCSDMAAKREAPGRYTVEQLVARANASA